MLLLADCIAGVETVDNVAPDVIDVGDSARVVYVVVPVRPLGIALIQSRILKYLLFLFLCLLLLLILPIILTPCPHMTLPLRLLLLDLLRRLLSSAWRIGVMMLDVFSRMAGVVCIGSRDTLRHVSSSLVCCSHSAKAV